MRVQLTPEHVAVWNGSLTVNFYTFDYNFHCLTIGGYTSDDPPSQVDALATILRYWYADHWDTVSRCPACGEPSDYCQGHGPMGDPQGYVVIALHDGNVHSMCHHLSDCRKEA